MGRTFVPSAGGGPRRGRPGTSPGAAGPGCDRTRLFRHDHPHPAAEPPGRFAVAPPVATPVARRVREVGLGRAVSRRRVATRGPGPAA